MVARPSIHLQSRPRTCRLMTTPTRPHIHEISGPYAFRHDIHIHYNFGEARFEGLTETFVNYLMAVSATSLASTNPSACMMSLTTDTVHKGPHQSAKRTRTERDTQISQHRNSLSEKCFTSVFSRMVPSSCPTAESIIDPLYIVNQHFQLHFCQVPRIAVNGYDDRIPAILVMLKHHFLHKKGFDVPHIFRESPSKEERDRAIDEINRGIFSGESHDVRVLADLLKVWFRELTVPILHEIEPGDMEKLMCQIKNDEVKDLTGHFKAILSSTECEILLWLVDLLVVVASNKEKNFMGIDQLAIVIAPNLVRIETDNLIFAVAFSKAVVEVFRSILEARCGLVHN
uniref:Uncharacterized protein AlNc14C73G4971 n=1 Tax=Albugo laibachii Nc14 TaxID=890382 RepID=F0WEB4_9STRA|nr:conserved hypothetical protein [Albugo laibachii Nc14]|eukprot:CCA19545.1 conserved hypothetical protein [Albugo laibachii Nc14]